MQLRLADYGKTLATRPLGLQLRQQVNAQMDGAVELDLGGILAMSHSFADELVAALAAQGANSQPPFEVRVFNASEEVLRRVERAVALRGATAALCIADPV
jgi:hypothetical protein